MFLVECLLLNVKSVRGRVEVNVTTVATSPLLPGVYPGSPKILEKEQIYISSDSSTTRFLITSAFLSTLNARKTIK